MCLLDVARIVSKGRRVDEDGTGWTEWVIFDKSTVPRGMTEEDYVLELDWHAYCGSPGGSYVRPLIVWHTSAYTVVEQSGGLDV